MHSRHSNEGFPGPNNITDSDLKTHAMKARILNKWHSPDALSLARIQIVPWEATLTEYVGTEERWINDSRF